MGCSGTPHHAQHPWDWLGMGNEVGSVMGGRVEQRVQSSVGGGVMKKLKVGFWKGLKVPLQSSNYRDH